MQVHTYCLGRRHMVEVESGSGAHFRARLLRIPRCLCPHGVEQLGKLITHRSQEGLWKIVLRRVKDDRQRLSL